jgi:hypothetical protein
MSVFVRGMSLWIALDASGKNVVHSCSYGRGTFVLSILWGGGGGMGERQGESGNGVGAERLVEEGECEVEQEAPEEDQEALRDVSGR